MQKNALIIGLGSIGKHHYKLLSTYGYVVHVVDPKVEKNTKSLTIKINSDTKFYKNIKLLPKHTSYDLAIVSNWATDHFTTFKRLISLGIKNIIVEKPLAVSFYEINQIENLVKKNKIKIVNHFQWSWSNVFEKLSIIQEKYALGMLESIQVNGGAKCIVTNGIHFISMAEKLFGNKLQSVVADLSSQKINPRGNAFDFFEGSATWTYSGNKFLSITFTNSSHMPIDCNLVYTFGNIRIYNNELQANYIPLRSRKKLDKKTRTLLPSMTLSAGPAFEDTRKKTGTDEIYRYFKGDLKRRKVTFSADVNANKSLLLALYSDKIGKRLKIKNLFISNKDLKYRWSIT